MVYEDRSSIERLGELTENHLSLEFKVLGFWGHKLKNQRFTKVHDPKSVIIYTDRVELKTPVDIGCYGKLYVRPLNIVATYFVPSDHNKNRKKG